MPAYIAAAGCWEKNINTFLKKNILNGSEQSAWAKAINWQTKKIYRQVQKGFQERQRWLTNETYATYKVEYRF